MCREYYIRVVYRRVLTQVMGGSYLCLSSRVGIPCWVRWEPTVYPFPNNLFNSHASVSNKYPEQRLWNVSTPAANHIAVQPRFQEREAKSWHCTSKVSVVPVTNMLYPCITVVTCVASLQLRLGRRVDTIGVNINSTVMKVRGYCGYDQRAKNSFPMLDVIPRTTSSLRLYKAYHSTVYARTLLNNF